MVMLLVIFFPPGNVGIGTASPGNKFTVNSTSANQASIQYDASTRLQISVAGSGLATFLTDNSAACSFTNKVGIGTTAPATTLEVDGILTMEDVSNPSEGVSGHAQMFSNSGEMKVNDASGNITTISPHNFELIPEGASEDMAWSHHSVKGNKKVNVDMMKLARLVEKLTGEKLVYTEET